MLDTTSTALQNLPRGPMARSLLLYGLRGIIIDDSIVGKSVVLFSFSNLHPIVRLFIRPHPLSDSFP
ncbi:hypothetical protein I7I48_07692 [Histoplasma ohiense]|nr:hypothetical protein I7I48_07692 [Histoplasma ohiense (nom. inval.)]